MQYSQMNPAALSAAYDAALEDYRGFQGKNLSLNLARGKPSAEQLSLSDGLYDTLREGFCSDGIDTRNYGELMGLPCARRYFADLLGCAAEQVLVGNNASLELMYNLVSKAYSHGLNHSPRPWRLEERVKFLIPVPAYDRHMNLSLSFGMELLPVRLLPDGPDMEQVERLAADPSVKGMWCVPCYTNPDGIVYGDEAIRRLASMRCGAPDFALLWDNAYLIHAFDEPVRDFPDMLAVCRAAGNPDRVYEFASTSKITFAGGGISCMAASVENLACYAKLLRYETIGADKVTQLAHVRFLQDRAHTLELMERHAAILRPKFHAVLDALETQIRPLGIGSWTSPKGGYFISYYALPSTAKRIVALCKGAGVTLTPAGATYPGGVDPLDSNIRLAPSYPPLDELEPAAQLFCIAVRLASLEQLCNRRDA